MDCCNYMQYRHHQPYYGSQFYDPLPAYHADFYGQQVYQEYYGNSPYYQQQWPCTTSFPDYVYNPKEARIRKAMRDATRERSIGTSPMLQRPNARRPPHSWISPHEELMMSPLGSMRAAMESPVCGFPLSSTGNNQFMGAMSGYSKMEPSPMPSSNYMQSSPLAQLQQHTEMWPDYQHQHPPMPPRTPGGNPFMMGDVPSPYQPQSTEIPMMEKRQSQMPPSPQQNSSPRITSPNRINENGASEQQKIHDVADFEQNKGGLEGARVQIEPPQEHFMPVFEQNDVESTRRPFEKLDEAKIKKPQQVRSNCKKSATKPLPDFNEAFGSTERGRFQSPPDPRLAPNNKGYLDYFFDSSPIKFEDYQI